MHILPHTTFWVCCFTEHVAMMYFKNIFVLAIDLIRSTTSLLFYKNSFTLWQRFFQLHVTAISLKSGLLQSDANQKLQFLQRQHCSDHQLIIHFIMGILKCDCIQNYNKYILISICIFIYCNFSFILLCIDYSFLQELLILFTFK